MCKMKFFCDQTCSLEECSQTTTTATRNGQFMIANNYVKHKSVFVIIHGQMHLPKVQFDHYTTLIYDLEIN